MPDEELRRVEREASAGDPDAETRLLRERLRTGALERSRVEIAAYLGHPAAGCVAPDTSLAGDTPQEWVSGLGAWGKPLVVRAAILAARHVLARFEETLTHEGAPREAIEAAEEWLVHPCEAHRVAARLSADRADDAAREASVLPEADDDTAFAAYAARDAALAAGGHDLEFACSRAAEAFDSAGAVETVLDPAVRVRQQLIEWALGER